MLEASDDPKNAKRETLMLGTSKCETLASCKYFTTKKITVADKYEVNIDATSFAVLFIADGKAVLSCSHSEMRLNKGDTLFLPADIGSITVNGKCELLKIT